MSPGSALLALWLSAPAVAAVGDSLVLGVPAEVDLVGLAAGVRPELLVGLDRSGVGQLRGAVGLLGGPEYLYLPVTAGLRARPLPRRRVHPLVGGGVELQSFYVPDAPPVARGAVFVELGLDVDVARRWSVGGLLCTEWAVTGVPGPGLGLRLGVSRVLRQP